MDEDIDLQDDVELDQEDNEFEQEFDEETISEISSGASIEKLEPLNQELKDKIASLPTSPGIYQYKNTDGKIIYVGKAKNLRSRVRSYFQEGRPVDAKTKALVAKICDVEVILVDSEAEAFLLEDNLIKKLKPRYNIMLRDDKTYPYVRVTNEEYPRIFATRKVIRDGSKYYGPFTEVKNMKTVLRTVRSMFLIRSCDLKIDAAAIEKKRFRVCLDYHIEKCQGPCQGFISKQDYNDNVSQAKLILTGKTRDLESALENKMMELAEEMKFEEAASLRNKLNALKDYGSKQKIVSSELIDRDVFGYFKEEDSACVLVLKIREGKLVGKRHYIVANCKLETDDIILQRAIEKWYMESDFIPKEIFLPMEPEQLEFLMDWLGKKRGKTISVQIPKLGDKRKIVEMACSNADFVLKEYKAAYAKREQIIPRSVYSLQRDLRMKNPPQRIECFDNSHIQGSDYVSSLVVFEDGRPKKSDYRKFKIQSFEGNDDFAAMREVVFRRYSRLVEENSPLPDLIIIDGGKGQLSSAYGILTDLGIAGRVTVIGLAKRLEEVFFPGEKDALLLPKTSSGLKLIQQLRDEAHRFAITFHRSLREKRTIKTALTEIPGIGEKTATKLLIEIGSVENVRNATLDDLAKVVGNKAAAEIKAYFEHKSL